MADGTLNFFSSMTAVCSAWLANKKLVRIGLKIIVEGKDGNESK